MPLTAREAFADVNGVRTHYLRAGAGQTLLYLHGSGGAGMWSPALATLAEQFDVIAPAHPGFGQSDRPDWLEGIDDMVVHYLDLLDALGLERAHLIGSSLGGWIAAELAVTNSQRLASLTLVDAAGLRVEGAAVPDMFAMDREAQTRIVFHDPALAEQALATPLDDDGLAYYLKNQTTLALLAWDPYLHDPKLHRRLHRISAPTLIVWGEQDRLIPLAHGRAYAEAIPGARLEVIPNCGHIPHQEQTDDFTRIVRHFLLSCRTQ
ncbi:MAG: alpha/beta fold hydrolase [Chloroflexota bacterium]